MARARLTQEERKARTREALVAAASRLFAQHGVEATSLDQVAAAAGFTKGAIYGSFADKRALVDAVIQRHVVSMDTAPLVDPALSLTERLGRIGRAVGELQRTVPRETVILDLEYSLGTLRNPRTHRWDADRFRAQADELRAKFAAVNQAQGAEPPFESGELLALLGILARGIVRALAETPDAFSPRAVETLFRLLGGEGAAPAKKRMKTGA